MAHHWRPINPGREHKRWYLTKDGRRVYCAGPQAIIGFDFAINPVKKAKALPVGADVILGFLQNGDADRDVVVRRAVV